MSEKQTIVNINLDGKNVALTLIRATARIGAERAYMIGTAFEYFKEHSDFPLSQQGLKWLLYPNAVCGTASVDGMPWPITFEEFGELPEDFIDEWEAGIYTVNPHWQPSALKETGDKPEVKNSPRPKRH